MAERTEFDDVLESFEVLIDLIDDLRFHAYEDGRENAGQPGWNLGEIPDTIYNEIANLFVRRKVQK